LVFLIHTELRCTVNHTSGNFILALPFRFTADRGTERALFRFV